MFQQFTQKYGRSLKFIWEIVYKKHRRYFIIALLTTIVARLIQAGLPYLAKFEMDQLAEKNATFFMFTSTPYGIFLIILWAIFVADLFKALIDLLFRLATDVEKSRLENSLLIEVTERTQFLDPGLSLSARYQRLIETARNTVNDAPNRIEELTVSKVGTLITAGSVLLVFSFTDYKIFLFVLASALFAFLIQRNRSAFMIHFDIKSAQELSSLRWNMEAALSRSYHHIVVNGATKSFTQKFSGLLEQISLSRRTEILGDSGWSIIQLLNENFFTMLVKMYVGYTIYYATGSIGLMTMTMLYTTQMCEVIQNILTTWIDKNKIADDLARMELFLGMTEDGDHLRVNEISRPIESIELNNCVFQYPKSAEAEKSFIDISIRRIESYKNKWSWDLDEIHMLKELKAEIELPSPEILHGINLEFKKGNIYGIVGNNGAGKTTLINLILGFFSNYKGTISYNQIEGKTIKRDSLYSIASYVSQDPFIMNGRFTIRENLTLGVEREVSDDELWALLEKFNLKTKIQKLRLGLNNNIGWDDDLSGGQRQLIAIIRTLLQDRPILILDEGTNQLDAENELRIMRELLKEKHKKIIIFITHRMSTIRHVDTIYCIEGGNITASGNHESLIGSDNAYARFYDIQHSKESVGAVE